uniref:Uncharacterized protein n=1 Tax=viral metagenome TaxID=1070528 RepID=A0A6M3IT40_9ZZZZ
MIKIEPVSPNAFKSNKDIVIRTKVNEYIKILNRSLMTSGKTCIKINEIMSPEVFEKVRDYYIDAGWSNIVTFGKFVRFIFPKDERE